MSYLDNVNIAWQDTPNVDAFGRARVSQVTTQFDAKQLHDALPLFIDKETIGTGSSSHNTTTAQSDMTTAATSDAAILQTKQRFHYQSGKSQLLFWTFNNFDYETNVTKRVGYFSANKTTPFNSTHDGFFLESGDGSITIKVYRSGTLVSEVARDSWTDSLDGTGTSGVTHDFDLNTILCADYEWLGVGRIRFCIVKDGAIIPFHTLDYTDSTSVYMSSPNQPMRWEIRQTGAGSGTFNVICSSVASEGSINIIGKDGAISDDRTHLNANNTSKWYYAIGIRLNNAKFDTMVDLVDVGLKSNTNDSYEWRLCMNPTYASTVTYNTITNYAVEYGLGVTANTVSAYGTILAAGYGVKHSLNKIDLNTAIRIGATIDHTADELVLIVKPHSSNLDIHRAINWREL